MAETLPAETVTCYSYLRSSLLDSKWLPRPVGVCVWSLMHIVLAVYYPLMLVTVCIGVLLLAIAVDIVMLLIFLTMALAHTAIVPVVLVIFFVGKCIVAALVWIWLVITCSCCSMAGREPGQGVGDYILSAGGVIPPRPVLSGAALECVAYWALLVIYAQSPFTMRFVKYVTSRWTTYWKQHLGNLCQEIVPQ